MRWRKDGADYLFGSTLESRKGGMVSWHIRPASVYAAVYIYWLAHAWRLGESMTSRIKFKTSNTAKRFVERWLERKPKRKGGAVKPTALERLKEAMRREKVEVILAPKAPFSPIEFAINQAYRDGEAAGYQKGLEDAANVTKACAKVRQSFNTDAARVKPGVIEMAEEIEVSIRALLSRFKERNE